MLGNTRGYYFWSDPNRGAGLPGWYETRPKSSKDDTVWNGPYQTMDEASSARSKTINVMKRHWQWWYRRDRPSGHISLPEQYPNHPLELDYSGDWVGPYDDQQEAFDCYEVERQILALQ